MSQETWAIIGKVLAVVILIFVLWGLIGDTVRQDWELYDLQQRIGTLEQQCK